LVGGGDEGEGDGEIAEGVGGEQQGAMSEVEFVDAECAGEVGVCPLAVGGHVGLADFPVEAIVEEAIGEIEVEVALHGLLEAMEAHAVVEESVDDGLANAVGVFGSRFDSGGLGTERLAAVAVGAIFSDGQFDDDDFAEGDVADESGVCVFPPTVFATGGAWEGLGGTSLAENANRSGVHACVLFGLVW